MTQPLTFTTATPRFVLPLLFAGQAQKEFYVNQAHALTDALLHPAVEGTTATPPSDAQDGESWLVGANATGEWEGHSLALASRQAGVWVFAEPREGMRIFDCSTKQYRHFYAGAWQSVATPTAPAGGSTIDSEARGAIAALIGALSEAGIFSGN